MSNSLSSTPTRHSASVLPATAGRPSKNQAGAGLTVTGPAWCRPTAAGDNNFRQSAGHRFRGATQQHTGTLCTPASDWRGRYQSARLSYCIFLESAIALSSSAKGRCQNLERRHGQNCPALRAQRHPRPRRRRFDALARTAIVLSSVLVTGPIGALRGHNPIKATGRVCRPQTPPRGRGSVQQGLSAAGSAYGFRRLGRAADKRYSFGSHKQ